MGHFIRLTIMSCTAIPSVFDHLASQRAQQCALAVPYDEVVRRIVAARYWNGGSVQGRRVLWTDARSARKADTAAFKLPGLYIWGAEDRPVYLGMTGKVKKTGDTRSFTERFGRYVGGEKSQCSLAREYGTQLVERGIDGFPAEIRSWYAKNYSGTARLAGAVRFATEGIDKIWFALFPASDPSLIRTLEKALIPIANAWNIQAGMKPLLNIESNRC